MKQLGKLFATEGIKCWLIIGEINKNVIKPVLSSDFSVLSLIDDGELDSRLFSFLISLSK